MLGPDTAEPISAMAMDGDAVWAAAGPRVLKYVRGKEVDLSLLLNGFVLNFSMPFSV